MLKSQLSVIILTHNDKELLKNCLISLRECLDIRKDEAIVVDNNSEDGTAEMVTKDFNWVKCIKLEKNIGVGPARNRGIASAQCEFIMTIDNDMKFLDVNVDLGKTIAKMFEREPKLGLLGFRLKDPNGETQRSTRRYPIIIQPLTTRLKWLQVIPWVRRQKTHHLMEDVDLDNISGLMDVDYVIGANQIYRKSTADMLNGYDEKIFYGPEDCDFCMRIHKKGLRVCYSTEISIEHNYQRASRRNVKLFFLHLQGFLYLFLKNKKLWRLHKSMDR